MVLRFQLNTICTCSLTRYVQRYTEFENYLEIHRQYATAV